MTDRKPRRVEATVECYGLTAKVNVDTLAAAGFRPGDRVVVVDAAWLADLVAVLDLIAADGCECGCAEDEAQWCPACRAARVLSRKEDAGG